MQKHRHGYYKAVGIVCLCIFLCKEIAVIGMLHFCQLLKCIMELFKFVCEALWIMTSGGHMQVRDLCTVVRGFILLRI